MLCEASDMSKRHTSNTSSMSSWNACKMHPAGSGYSTDLGRCRPSVTQSFTAVRCSGSTMPSPAAVAAACTCCQRLSASSECESSAEPPPPNRKPCPCLDAADARAPACNKSRVERMLYNVNVYWLQLGALLVCCLKLYRSMSAVKPVSLGSTLHYTGMHLP